MRNSKLSQSSTPVCRYQISRWRFVPLQLVYFRTSATGTTISPQDGRSAEHESIQASSRCLESRATSEANCTLAHILHGQLSSRPRADKPWSLLVHSVVSAVSEDTELLCLPQRDRYCYIAEAAMDIEQRASEISSDVMVHLARRPS